MGVWNPQPGGYHVGRALPDGFVRGVSAQNYYFPSVECAAIKYPFIEVCAGPSCVGF